MTTLFPPAQANENCADNEPCACGNCGWNGPVSALDEIHDAQERLYPNEIVPAGECPECGALAYLQAEAEEPISALDRQAAISAPDIAQELSDAFGQLLTAADGALGATGVRKGATRPIDNSALVALSAAVANARNVYFAAREAERAARNKPGPRPILAVIVEGGLVQSICSDQPRAFDGATILTIDYDVEPDDSDAVMVPQGNGTAELANVSRVELASDPDIRYALAALSASEGEAA